MRAFLLVLAAAGAFASLGSLYMRFDELEATTLAALGPWLPHLIVGGIVGAGGWFCISSWRLARRAWFVRARRRSRQKRNRNRQAVVTAQRVYKTREHEHDGYDHLVKPLDKAQERTGEDQLRELGFDLPIRFDFPKGPAGELAVRCLVAFQAESQ